MRHIPYQIVTAESSVENRIANSWHLIICAIACLMLLTAGATSGHAAGLLEALFGRPQPAQQMAPPEAPAVQNFKLQTIGHKKVALKSKKQRRKIAMAKRLKDSSRAICVRVSDGYFFAPSNAGSTDIASLQSACNRQCPNLETHLFLYPKGSDKIENARDSRNGLRYSTISVNFKLASLNPNANSCHPLPVNVAKSSGSRDIYTDTTLRRGDLVATITGLRVFKGRHHFPYDDSDFVSYRQSEDMPKQKMAQLDAMERIMKMVRR